jgi:PTH1 family peptidyl-tRNA hydrolase
VQPPIQLIVGLGNPGPEYSDTRHNVGAWFTELLAEQHNLSLKPETKFKGLVSRIQNGTVDCWLLNPSTYMNHSGQAVKAMASFYKIPPEAILVAHDELDFPAGTIKLKQDGGHGGHNGLRDIIRHLNSQNFHRLRIGIGHPGHRDHVIDYVLHTPSRSDHQQIMAALDETLPLMPELLAGNVQAVTKKLHTRP